jgi:hypothetical protein
MKIKFTRSFSLLAISAICAPTQSACSVYDCKNQIFESIFSEKGDVKAVIFERNCGATTTYSTHISILDVERRLQNLPGNALIVEGKPSDLGLRLTWERENSLTIEIKSENQIYKKEDLVNGISVTYKFRP